MSDLPWSSSGDRNRRVTQGTLRTKTSITHDIYQKPTFIVGFLYFKTCNKYTMYTFVYIFCIQILAFISFLNIYSCILCMYTFIISFYRYAEPHSQGAARIPASSRVPLSRREDHDTSPTDYPLICFSSINIGTPRSDHGQGIPLPR